MKPTTPSFFRLTLFVCMLLVTLSSYGQYTFSAQDIIECTAVKNQNRTGTCWSFATASFLESELIRMGHKNVNLSEMYIVRNIYKDKALNYVLRQGKANFSQGSLAHDLIRMTARNGLITEQAYSGLVQGDETHDHSEMEKGLKGFLDGIRTGKTITSKWDDAFDAILDVYMGSAPKKFDVDGKSYTPKSYATKIGIDAEDYVSLTSFSHHPFHSQFILEIPDNYSNGAFHNIPLTDLMKTIDNALSKGYTIAWDGDVSEKGFSARNGIAVLDKDTSREDLFDTPGTEIKVNQTNRQEAFETYRTTDDHLMHIVGTTVDQKGTKYYIVKNSWGEISDYKGYLHMSEAYMKMKTVSILLHKEAVPKQIASKLF